MADQRMAELVFAGEKRVTYASTSFTRVTSQESGLGSRESGLGSRLNM